MLPSPEATGRVIEALETGGYIPVLIGGVAMQAYGFPLATNDMDLMVFAVTSERKAGLVHLFWKHGYRLGYRSDPKTGFIVDYATSESEAVEKIREADPNFSWWWNPETETRIDVLFDFPISAKELAERARIEKLDTLGGVSVRIASPEDLKSLYTTAYNGRRHKKDLQFSTRSS